MIAVELSGEALDLYDNGHARRVVEYLEHQANALDCRIGRTEHRFMDNVRTASLLRDLASALRAEAVRVLR